MCGLKANPETKEQHELRIGGPAASLIIRSLVRVQRTGIKVLEIQRMKVWVHVMKFWRSDSETSEASKETKDRQLDVPVST